MSIFLISNVYSVDVSYVKDSENLNILFSFENPNLYKNGDFWDIDIPGLENVYSEGEPVLPAYVANVLVPKGYVVDDIEYEVLNKSFLIGGTPLIGQKIVTLSEELPNENFLDSRYATNDVFNFSYSDFRGYNLIKLKIVPVEYIRDSKEIYFVKEIKIVLKLSSGEYENSFFRGTSSDEEEISSMIINPQEIETYRKQTSYGKFYTLNVPEDFESYPYIIITTDYLNKSNQMYNFSTLLNWKKNRANYSINGTIVLVEEIYNDSRFYCDGEFGDGCCISAFNDSAAQIRNFIKYAYQNLSTRYILLGGNITVIPTRSVRSPGTHDGVYSYILTDAYFSNLNGSFNDNMDGVWLGENDTIDWTSEVYVGRAPVSNYTELFNFVRKTILYENLSIGKKDPYLRNVVGSYDPGSALRSFREINEYFGLKQFSIVNQPWSVPGNKSLPEYLNKARDTVNVPQIININGHGAVVSVSGFYSGTIPEFGPPNVENFSNYGHPFFMYIESCLSGDFSRSDSISVKSVTTKNNSFAVIANSHYGWTIISEHIQRSFWEKVYNSTEELRSIGRIFFMNKNAYSTHTNTHKWTYWSSNLMGDPETRIFFEPEELFLPDIRVYSPVENYVYSNSSILLNVSSNFGNNENNILINGVNYSGAHINDSFSDGKNVLVFYLTDGVLSSTKNITFFVDLTEPTLIDNTNFSNFSRFNGFNFSINFSDEYGISEGYLESDYNGTMINYSFSDLFVDANQSSANFNVSLNVPTNIWNFTYKFYVIDSVGRVNSTDTQNIIVKNSLPILNDSYSSISFGLDSNFSLNKSLLFTELDDDEVSIVNIYAENVTVSNLSEEIVLSNNSGVVTSGQIILEVNDTRDMANYTMRIIVRSPNWVNSTSSFDGNTTNLSGLNTFLNVPLVLEKLSSGKINFLSINLTEPEINFSDLIRIEKNKIFVNSSAFSLFNVPARIYFYNTGFNDTNKFVLYKDNEVCSSCNNFEFNSTTKDLVVNVLGFSTYEVRNTTCADGIKNGAETGKDCGGNCPACPISSSGSSSGGGGGGGISPAKSSNSDLEMIMLDNLKELNLNLSLNESVMFFLGNRGYILSIEEINNNGTVFNFSNKQYNINFSEQFLLGDIENGCENISISFEKISETEVSVLFKLKIKPEEAINNETSAVNIVKVMNYNYYWIIVIVVVFVVALLWFIFRKKKRDTNL